MNEVQLFSTCLAEEFFPQVIDAAATVLEGLRVKVIPVRRAFCCGQVAFNEGLRAEAIGLARRFLKSVQPGIPIVVPSGSCTSMLKIFYGDLLTGEPALAEKAAAIRPWIFEFYREAVARAGGWLPAASDLNFLFESHEYARFANRIIWPAIALVKDRAEWGFDELAEVERWFEDLEPVFSGDNESCAAASALRR